MNSTLKSILACLGNSPIVSIDKINQMCGTNVIVKLEKTNPGGSIKDRPAVYIIDYAERNGLLSPGGTIIESSSGNFGISLAMIGAARGYRVIILVDPKATATNIALMKAYGAEVIVVDKKDDSGSYHKTRIQLANELATQIPNAYRPDQCFNVLSCFAHKHSTAQELLEQTDGGIAGAVAAVSTGGQIGGLAEYFSEQPRKYVLAAVDAYGSTIFGGAAHAYKSLALVLAGRRQISLTSIKLITYTASKMKWHISLPERYAEMKGYWLAFLPARYCWRHSHFLVN